MGTHDQTHIEYGRNMVHWKETDLERLQLQIGKALLVDKSCVSKVVRGELTWWKIASRADYAKLKFWVRLANMPKECCSTTVFAKESKQ